MSTKGSYGFIYNNELKLIYNHFDSYPEGIGFEILDFIFKINIRDDWDFFKSQLSKISFLEDIDDYNNDYDTKPKNFLNDIYNGKVEKYLLYNNFIHNSLFCEYAYIINLDDMTLEYYIGFQKKPQQGNRFGTESYRGYYPCRLKAIFDIKNDDLSKIVNKILDLGKNSKDDVSVFKYFRKKKLEIINT